MTIDFASEPTTISLEQWPNYAYDRRGNEYAQIANETPAVDIAEQLLLDSLINVIFDTGGLREVRDFAPLVRFLFPEPTYIVGCGSNHVWVQRQDEQEKARTEQRWPNRMVIIYPAGDRIWSNYNEVVFK